MFFYLTLSLKGDKPICFLTWSFSVERVFFFPREFKGETSFRNRFLRCRFDHKMLVKEGFRVQVSTFYVRKNRSQLIQLIAHHIVWWCFCGAVVFVVPCKAVRFISLVSSAKAWSMAGISGSHTSRPSRSFRTSRASLGHIFQSKQSRDLGLRLLRDLVWTLGFRSLNCCNSFVSMFRLTTFIFSFTFVAPLLIPITLIPLVRVPAFSTLILIPRSFTFVLSTFAFSFLTFSFTDPRIYLCNL